MIKLSKFSDVAHATKYLLIFLLCFFIPVSKITCSYIIGFTLLCWLFEGKLKERFFLIFSDKKRIAILSLSVLYILYLLGLVITKNFNYAVFDLQVKLSLIIFPIIFSTIDFKYYNNDIILSHLILFIYGVLLNVLICTIHAAYLFLFKDHDPGHFLYAKLAGALSFHVNYLAMYLNFAITTILILLNSETYNVMKKNSKLLIFCLVLFSVFIIFLSSKAGIISMVLTYLIFIIYIIIKQRRIKLGVIMLLAIIISCVGLFMLVPSALNRLKVAVEVVSKDKKEIKEVGESTSDRILIWNASTEIIKDNFLLGVGTGDVKDVLMDKYKEKNLWYTYEHKLNAHNQFLQTFISIGVFGFLVLLASIIIPLIYAIKRNNLIYVFFLIIFLINISVESMLENQAGVVFYAFFNSFLLMVSYKKTITD